MFVIGDPCHLIAATMFVFCQGTDQLPLSLSLYSILVKVHNDLQFWLHDLPNTQGCNIGLSGVAGRVELLKDPPSTSSNGCIIVRTSKSYHGCLLTNKQRLTPAVA